MNRAVAPVIYAEPEQCPKFHPFSALLCEDL
jgi:hypothetical protein